jgi:dihydroorotate dehydrogenase electron transfer subunit
MPCGVGTCLGCVVQASSASDEFKRICKDGPVFDGEEVTI